MIYDLVIMVVICYGRDYFNKVLFGFKVFGEVIYVVCRGMLQCCCEVEEFFVFIFVYDDKQKRKFLFYGVIYQFVMDNVEEGVKILEEVVFLLGVSLEYIMFKLIVF